MACSGRCDGKTLEQLTVTIDLTDATSSRLSATGEIDAASCSVLDSALFEAMAAGCTNVGVDRSGVEFMDSSGIRVLVRYGERLREIGGRLTLSAVSRPVEQVLQLTGLLALLTED